MVIVRLQNVTSHLRTFYQIWSGKTFVSSSAPWRWPSCVDFKLNPSQSSELKWSCQWRSSNCQWHCPHSDPFYFEVGAWSSESRSQAIRGPRLRILSCTIMLGLPSAGIVMTCQWLVTIITVFIVTVLNLRVVSAAGSHRGRQLIPSLCSNMNSNDGALEGSSPIQGCCTPRSWACSPSRLRIISDW